ncbi:MULTISPECIES: Swt1 family HEPN domain-containing protein [Stenotrophomonas]|uniref:Swt1 family HEPN domain-containing protein n=1 Tax=Stenotrophomonas TaxID=40323 RepID=UPI002E798297|nr:MULTISPECIES: Swt1 family HEPN domain-containing protein [Stenotrophomonas]
MNDHTIELFVLKCAVIQSGLNADNIALDPDLAPLDSDERLEPFIRQFDASNRRNAAKMSRYYELFYLLENDIRRLIVDTMESAHGSDWWSTHVSQGVADEAKKNQKREADAGVSSRSEDNIDYITFGQLGEIIRDNWGDFAGMLSNQSAVNRALSGLNMLRGTIAHCGVLAEDEVDRLKLAIRDWFRVLEGPRN